MTLREVVVSATRYVETESSIPAFVSVITQNDIEASPAKNIADLLRGSTGAQVSDITGNGKSYTVDLRGFGETAGLNTLVLVDGRRVNQADLSGTDWTQIPLDRVKRIEITRGGRGSVLYGDNAAGGVINIITTGRNKFFADITASTGSYNIKTAKASIGNGSEGFNYSFSGSTLETGGHRDNSGMKSEDFGLNVDFATPVGNSISMSAGYHKDKAGLPGAILESKLATGMAKTESPTPDDYADTSDYYFKTKPEVAIIPMLNVYTDFSFRKRKSLFYSSWGAGTFAGDTVIDTLQFSPGISHTYSGGGLTNKIIGGIDFHNSKEAIVNDSSLSGKSIYSLEKDSSGTFLHDELGITDSFSLSAGARNDKANYSFDPSTPGKAEMSEKSKTYGFSYKLPGGSYIYSSVSESFRYPVLDEFFNFFSNTVDDTLKAQRSKNYEVGFKEQISQTSFSKINLFSIETDNEIFYNPVIWANSNMDGKTKREGIEFSYTYDDSIVLFNFNMSYTKGLIEGGSFDGSTIPGSANQKGAYTIGMRFGEGFLLSFNGNYMGKRYFVSDFANRYGKADSYTVHNMRFAQDTGVFSAYIDVNNIADADYSEYGVLGFNPETFGTEKAFFASPGRNYMVGVSARF